MKEIYIYGHTINSFVFKTTGISQFQWIYFGFTYLPLDTFHTDYNHLRMIWVLYQPFHFRFGVLSSPLIQLHFISYSITYILSKEPKWQGLCESILSVVKVENHYSFYSIYIHSNCTNEIHIELDQIGLFITTISYYQMGWTDPISSTIQRWSHILEFDYESWFNWNHEQSNGRGTGFNQWSHFIPIR